MNVIQREAREIIIYQLSFKMQRSIETYLATVIVFLAVWLWKDFLGWWLSVIFGAICTAVLVVAIASELIESTRVPRNYFWMMGALIAGIISAALLQKLF
jgi:hypothetical protein